MKVNIDSSISGFGSTSEKSDARHVQISHFWNVACEDRPHHLQPVPMDSTAHSTMRPCDSTSTIVLPSGGTRTLNFRSQFRFAIISCRITSVTSAMGPRTLMDCVSSLFDESQPQQPLPRYFHNRLLCTLHLLVRDGPNSFQARIRQVLRSSMLLKVCFYGIGDDGLSMLFIHREPSTSNQFSTHTHTHNDAVPITSRLLKNNTHQIHTPEADSAEGLDGAFSTSFGHGNWNSSS